MPGIPSEESPSSPRPVPRIEELRQKLSAAERATGLACECGAPLHLGIAAIDAILGGGLGGGALHEIAAVRESAILAVTGFALGLTARFANRSRRSDMPGRISQGTAVLWIGDDFLLQENGAPYGPGLEQAGIAPEHLITVAATRTRDVLWAMEEALRCRFVGVVIGETAARGLDQVAMRRLSLAAAAGTRWAFSCARRATIRPAPSRRAGSSAQRRPLRLPPRKGAAASARRAWLCVLRATAVVVPEHGLWSGTVWSSVSSSQRILSLWLEQLSTDRIAQRWHDARRASFPLVVYGRRGNLDLLTAVNGAAERLGVRGGLALAQARAKHPALTT